MASGNDQFITTHWSLVLEAGRKSSPNFENALAALCRIYWRPLYAFVRRRVADVHEAQDLTQEFFARLLENNNLAVANPNRGRFRSFLLTACKHFLINEWKKGTAQKRGGNKVVLSLDFASVDSQFPFEPGVESNPDREYDRDWAVTLINHVLGRLQQEYSEADKETQFEQLAKFISGAAKPTAYQETATSMNMSEGAVRTAAHRLRKRYKELLKEEIAHTVTSPEEVEEEIRNLFVALGPK